MYIYLENVMHICFIIIAGIWLDFHSVHKSQILPIQSKIAAK